MKNNIENKLHFNKKEDILFVPNEIYEDIQKSNIKNIHIPFAFSYYYLISWLYRYAKYSSITLDNKDIKEILGYSRTFPEVDYIIKKNGMLDQIGYTETTKNYPIVWELNDDELEFTYLNNLEEDMQKIIKGTRSRKYTIKLPIKAFHRYMNDVEMKQEYDSGYTDGTFFEVDNTHMIPFEVFVYCMENKNIGRTGFYLWSFLQSKCQLYGGFDITVDDLSAKTSLPRSTLCSYLDKLKSYRMIDFQHNQDFFCLSLNDSEKKANTYIANSIDSFTYVPVPYSKMTVITKEEYKLIKEQGLMD